VPPACRKAWKRSWRASSGCLAGSASASAWPARCNNDPAVLILDEPTSSLDNATERELMQAVRGPPERTIIVLHTASARWNTATASTRLDTGDSLDEIDGETSFPTRRITPAPGASAHRGAARMAGPVR